VVLVLDQWPQWAFEAKRAELTGGFRRLLSEGVWYVGEHPSAATLTAPGHALIGSGAPSSTSGILANEWYHRDLDKRLGSIEDVDGSRTAKWSRVFGLGDSIARANTGAKAVAIALKDRSAILSLGHAGLSIWYDNKAVAWTSHQVPAWLAALNQTPIPIHEIWKPVDPALLAKLSGLPDNNAGELGEKKFGATFPHEPDATGDAADAVFSTPTGIDISFTAATAAIDGEGLGEDEHGDLLVISLSAHDYVGHGWGHESWEMWDLELRLDRAIDQFLGMLDRRVGRGRWSMIVTSDHGASPVPERAGDGGRLDYETIHEVAAHAAMAELGEGRWVANVKYPNVFFTRELLAKPEDVRDRASAAVASAIAALPGIAWARPKTQLAGDCDNRIGDARVICLALDVERSGELVYMPKPHWILQDRHEKLATSHGSMYAYDRQVPMIVLAPDRTAHAPHTRATGTRSMTEVAPLVARWLRVTPPLELR